MKRRKKNHVILVCFALLTMAVASGRSLATLGGSADSIESDRKVLAAVRGSTTGQNGYTVQEITYGGTIVREYVSSSGVVFAIAWNGVRSPDLTSLLGTYADQYQRALQNTPHRPGVRHSSIKGDNVVVERWGHVGNVQGRAYDPALIPTGVTIDEIK